MSEHDELLVRTEGHVRWLTINRPARSNSLSSSLLRSLSEAFVAAGDDPEVRVVVLTAVGQRAFCGGVDLKEIREQDAAGRPYRPPMQGLERHLFEIILETYKPTIAALNGTAVAGGFELALACDIRIASEEARVGLPEARRGMGANFGSVVLPKMIPLGMALEILFTGDYLTAEEARALGLVNRVVPADQVESAAAELAGRIAENAPVSIRRMKEMALKSMALPLAAALRLDVGPNPYLSEDRQEGIRAFVEGRKPRWKGR